MTIYCHTRLNCVYDSGSPSRLATTYSEVATSGQKIQRTVTPKLGEKAAHNGNVVYTLDFQVTPHQLRHTYITNLIYSGADPKTVQYLAGHKHSKITMDIYAKVKYNKPKQLSSVVNKAFAPKTSPSGNESDNG